MQDITKEKLGAIEFKIHEDAAIGVFDAYPTMIMFYSPQEQKETGICCEINFAVEKYNAGKLSKQIPDGENKIIKMLSKGNNQTFCLFTVNNTSEEDIANKLPETLAVMTGILKANKVTPQTKCVICAQSNTDDHLIFPDETNQEIILCRPTHIKCFKKQYDEAVRINAGSANPAMLFIMVVLGAFIGSLPTIATVIFMKREWAILDILIPISAYWFYRLAKGKGSLGTGILVAAVSLIMPILQTVLIGCFMVTREQPGTSFIGLFLTCFLNPHVFSEMLKESWFSLICAAVGIFSLWKNMTKSDEETIKDMEQIVFHKTDSLKDYQEKSLLQKY